MNIYFHGAVGDVTGSAYHVKTKHASVLVDCGLFQGSRQAHGKNRNGPRLAGGKLDAVLLTHGHLDHVGRLPILTKRGYSGAIYGTQATIDLGSLIVRDAAHIQEQDLARENRRRDWAGLPRMEPLYEPDDARRLAPLAKAVAYDRTIEVAPGIQARWVDAGHMLGSASIEMTVEEAGRKKVVVFSGDLGPRGAPLLRDATPFERADVVIMESTYGDRNHRSLEETLIETREIIKKAVENKGKILVPTFAVGRTQVLLYYLGAAFRNKTLPRFPVFVDSPMAIEATKIYAKHVELFDEEALALVKSGDLRKNLDMVKPCPTATDSKALNDVPGPCLIMAGAGMCNAGRIVHHLRQNLHKPETTVLIVGYQSPGSLGRRLVDGEKYVSIFNDRIVVNASVHTMGGFSAHAGQSDLLDWFTAVAPARPRLILTHGEDRARQTLARLIKAQHGIRAECPSLGDLVEV
jgi:metallo-beta-lactamase family protein